MLIGVVALAALALAVGGPVSAATDLMLAPNLSFTNDSSPNFPIEGKKPRRGYHSPRSPDGNLFSEFALLEHGARSRAAGSPLSAV
jgi:hypothetical protein